MKKIIISTILLGAVCLSGCITKDTYTVTKEEYEECCTFESYLPKMNSLNFTVKYKESNSNKIYEAVTKFDNGKIYSSTGNSEFYVIYKEGTYNSTANTWTIDYIWDNEGAWNKATVENVKMPDDVFLPTASYVYGFDDLTFDAETNYYEQIEEDKVLNGSYHYSEGKVKFLNGKVVYISYKYKADYAPNDVYLTEMEIINYGTTEVIIPNVN